LTKPRKFPFAAAGGFAFAPIATKEVSEATADVPAARPETKIREERKTQNRP
jgi:hypothetical protein